jgi:hypothetical protein
VLRELLAEVDFWFPSGDMLVLFSKFLTDNMVLRSSTLTKEKEREDRGWQPYSPFLLPSF